MELTAVAGPAYFASMGLEAWWLRKRAAKEGGPRPTDYEWHDTVASLTMGTASLILPLVAHRRMRSLEAIGNRRGRRLLAGAAALGAAAAVGDLVARSMNSKVAAGEVPAPTSSAISSATSSASSPAMSLEPTPSDLSTPDSPNVASPGSDLPELPRSSRRRQAAIIARTAGGTAAAAMATAGAVTCATWASRTAAARLFERRIGPDLGNGVLAFATAMVGWDFIYYWNHRLQHESRFLWAIHVVHHSSERYNLSTALRQPVADSLGLFVPYGLMSLLGIRPSMIETARSLNLLYQFWIHTDAIRDLGPLEKVLNTPSHHRAHHGSNRQYLDRNHGGILISWDKIFGTFEPEDEPVVYGLTKNIDTFNPLRIATHEYVDMADDVARSDNWSDRFSYVVRGPGWAYEQRRLAGVK